MIINHKNDIKRLTAYFISVSFAFLLNIYVLSGQQKAEPDNNSARTLSVAAVQMRSGENLQENVNHMSELIKKCAAYGARVVVFPECALSGYFKNIILELTEDQINKAEAQVADACKEAKVYGIIGLPFRTEGKLFNSASIITPEGKIIERYHKVQLAEDWPHPGDHLSVFMIDDIPCSVIICHDERYPELVRLPVLAGARVVFYISYESGIRAENKIDPYRAQIQARAVENNVFIVHSNAPANTDATGSHGQSRIIAPDGNIIKEASIFNEDIVMSTIDIGRASRSTARRSMMKTNRTDGVLQSWWEEGVKYVKIIK